MYQDELLVLGLGPMETPGEAGEGESQARLSSQQIECLGALRLGLVQPRVPQGGGRQVAR